MGQIVKFVELVHDCILSKQNQNQNQNSLLVKRQTDNTTPGGDGA